MLITLTKEEIEQATNVASLRNQSQREAGRADGLVKGSSLGRDLQGALSELAVSKALNLSWDGKFLPIKIWDKWKHEGNDVGKLEIRSTDLPTGRLILHHSDKNSPFILVISSVPEFKLVGWILGDNGKQKKYWRNNVPRPCYMVPQSDLESMDSLLEMLEKNDNQQLIT